MEMLTVVASRIPFLLVWMVAFGLGVARWGKHPVASALVCTASVIEALTGVAGAVLPLTMRQAEMSISTISLAMGALGIVAAIGYALLVAAVFVERKGANDAPVLPR